MKNSGKILRGGFWLLLVASITIGYFNISEASETEHYKFIPKDVDGVAVFDGRQISRKFIDRFRYNPREMEDVLPKNWSTGEDIEFYNIGLDPFYKVVVFHFQVEGRNYCALLLKCDTRSFLNFLEELPDMELVEEYETEDNVVCIKSFNAAFQKVTVCAGQGVGIYCFTIDGKSIDKNMQTKLNAFLSNAIKNPQDGLLASNKNFETFGSNNEDVGYWSNGETIGFGALSKDFVDSRTYFSFEQGEIVINSELEFKEENPLKPIVRPLNSEAPFAFSFMANEKRSWNFVEENVPASFLKFLQGYNGNFFFEINGHQFYQGHHIVDSIDEVTFETYDVVVKNEKLTPFPEFTTVFGVNDISAYRSSLNADTSYRLKDGFYEFEMIEGVTCYIKTLDSNVCISNNKEHINRLQKTSVSEIYATYSLKLDFVALKGNFPVKGDLGIGIPNMIVHTGFELLNFEKLHIDVVGLSDSKVKGSGAFKFKDAEMHSIDAVLDMVDLGFSNRGIIEGLLFQTER